MKRKFINVMCTMALAFVIGASFVGCKDYDDDINDLQKQIDKVASDLATLKSSMGKYVQSVAYDSKTGLLTVTGGDGSTASATIQQNLPAYTISITNGNTVNLLQDGKVISSAAITFPAQSEEFDPAKLTVVDGKIMYDGKATGVTLPKTTESSLVAFEDAEGNTLGYTITVGETTADFYIQDATPLKSMVFVPETYLGGIEASPIVTFALDSYKQTVKDEPATTTGEVWEAIGGSAYNLSSPAVLYYHLNPSTVTKAQIKNVTLLAAVKEYVDVRAAGDAFTAEVKSYEVADGLLKVTFEGSDVVKPNMTAGPDYQNKVCVVAAQVLTQFNKADDAVVEQKTITSDYAAVYPENRSDLLISYTADLVDNINSAQVVVNHNIYGTHTTPHSASLAINADPDYKFDYDKTIDVKKLVKVEYEDAAGALHYITVDKLADYGLSLTFALSNYYGATDNQTPQNEFASLSADGILSSRVYEGSGVASVGRMPLVRYEVRDTKNAKVVAVGWMKFLITKSVDVVKDFEAGTYTCAGLTNTFTVKDMNVNVYNKLGLTYATFHAAYSVFTDGTGAGSVTSNVPATDNLETAVLTWVIPANQIDLTKPDKVYTHTCSYSSPSNPNDRVTFKFTTKATGFPTVTLDQTSKIDEYWYGANQDSVKINVATPQSGTDDDPAHCTFTSDLDALFMGNHPTLVKGAQNGADFNTFTASYAFSEKNTNRKVKGVSGATYTLSVHSDATNSYITTSGSDFAQIELATGKVTYNNDLIAQDILNISSHKDHPFFAYIDVVGKANGCAEYFVAETFKAAFLRPVDMAGVAGKYFEDARDGGDTLKLMDLISLSDWRDQAFSAHANYYGFYHIDVLTNINMIKAKITTNLGGGTLGTTLLSTVTNQIDINQVTVPVIGTNPSYVAVIYKNIGFNVQEFTLRIPFTVTYKYGTFTSYIDVLVKHTINNPTNR